MDPEDLQAELLALRRLYRLLVNDDQCVEDTGSQNVSLFLQAQFDVSYYY